MDGSGDRLSALFERKAALRNALDHLQAIVGEPANAPRKIFGGLHDLLAADPCPAELVLFRTLLRHHMVRTSPLSPGDELLGEPVLSCERRSIQTSSGLLQRPESFVPRWTLPAFRC